MEIRVTLATLALEISLCNSRQVPSARNPIPLAAGTLPVNAYPDTRYMRSFGLPSCQVGRGASANEARNLTAMTSGLADGSNSSSLASRPW